MAASAWLIRVEPHSCSWQFQKPVQQCLKHQRCSIHSTQAVHAHHTTFIFFNMPNVALLDLCTGKTTRAGSSSSSTAAALQVHCAGKCRPGTQANNRKQVCMASSCAHLAHQQSTAVTTQKLAQDPNSNNNSTKLCCCHPLRVQRKGFVGYMPAASMMA